MLAATIFSARVGASSCILRNPVADSADAVIIDHFRVPKCERCSGNRGIELQLRTSQPIFAATDGVMSFRGEVNRTKYLVLLTDNNRRITYGKILESKVRVGDRVVAGQQIAISGPNLYFSIREYSGGVVQYLDPMKYLADAVTNHRKAVLISDKHGLLTERNPLNLQC